MGIEKFSVGQFVSHCKVGQLWMVLTTILGLIAGAFGLGYKTHNIVYEAKVSHVQLEVGQLKAELKTRADERAKIEKETLMLRDKERFLSLFLRYQLAKESRRDHNDKSEVVYREAREALDEYVIDRVGRDKLIMGKGGGRQATVRFDDGTIWTIPSELHAAAKK